MFNTKITKKNFKKYIDDFRQKNIPKEFNQIRLTDELLNNDIDHYISISNRSDGKTFNYIHFFLKFALDTDIQLLFLSRERMLRKSYQDLIIDIIDASPYFNSEKLQIINTQFFREIVYKDKTMGFISDLNEATDLKYFSSQLKNVGVIIYDEFLALESDYLSDEREKLKTIYSTVNRNFDLKVIKYPKIFYLGNAVNLSSPILAHLDIFSNLESQPINSMRIYNNICIELRKNDNINEKRNLRAFDEEKDPLTTGQFKINNHNVAIDNDFKKAYNIIIVKLKNNFLKIRFSDDLNIIILGIIGYSPTYNYNTQAKDNSYISTYLNEKYFNPKKFKYHLNDIFLYDNNYSKDYILNKANNIFTLDIFKIIKNNIFKKNNTNNKETTQTVYNTFMNSHNYIELSKKSILSKLF